MNRVDGLASPRPGTRAPEDWAGPAMGPDGESTDRLGQVGEPSGRERGSALVPKPKKRKGLEGRPEAARAPDNWHVGYHTGGREYPTGGGKSPTHLQMEESLG